MAQTKANTGAIDWDIREGNGAPGVLLILELIHEQQRVAPNGPAGPAQTATSCFTVLLPRPFTVSPTAWRILGLES